MKDRIISVEAIEILDSRGNPTIRTRVSLGNGVFGTASVPSGHQLEKMRLLNFVMETRSVMEEKVC